jgi:hypothetical protein
LDGFFSIDLPPVDWSTQAQQKKAMLLPTVAEIAEYEAFKKKLTDITKPLQNLVGGAYLKAWRDRLVADQEETDAEWRPWFENLNHAEQQIFAQTVLVFASTGIVSYHVVGMYNVADRLTKYPEGKSRSWWVEVKSRMARVENHIGLLVDAVPALTTIMLPTTCGCWESAVGSSSSVMWHIIHRNDTHKMSFEEIAAWLDTLDIDLTLPIPDTIVDPVGYRNTTKELN